MDSTQTFTWLVSASSQTPSLPATAPAEAFPPTSPVSPASPASPAPGPPLQGLSTASCKGCASPLPPPSALSLPAQLHPDPELPTLPDPPPFCQPRRPPGASPHLIPLAAGRPGSQIKGPPATTAALGQALPPAETSRSFPPSPLPLLLSLGHLHPPPVLPSQPSCPGLARWGLTHWLSQVTSSLAPASKAAWVTWG